MIIDIHTHTYPTSDDSLLTPDQLVEESKRAGLDGICITDHDGFWSPYSDEALAGHLEANQTVLIDFTADW